MMKLLQKKKKKFTSYNRVLFHRIYYKVFLKNMQNVKRESYFRWNFRMFHIFLRFIQQLL